MPSILSRTYFPGSREMLLGTRSRQNGTPHTRTDNHQTTSGSYLLWMSRNLSSVPMASPTSQSGNIRDAVSRQRMEAVKRRSHADRAS
eukprot:1271928-Rhodomonas_salina.1